MWRKEKRRCSRIERRRTDRIHDRFADDFADCGVDSAAVHGRYHGAAVPRIRRNLAVTILVSAVVSLTLTPMLCAKLLRHTKDANKRAVLPGFRTSVRNEPSRFTAGRLSGCCEHRNAHNAGCGRQRWCSPSFYTSSSRRDFSLFRTQVRSRALPKRTRASLSSHVETATASGARDSGGSGGRQPFLLYRRGRHQHHPELPGEFKSI